MNSQIMLNRLRNQVSEQENKHNTYKVLKSDVYRLLCDYTDGNIDDLILSVSVDEKGRYIITIKAIAKILNCVGSILPD